MNRRYAASKRGERAAKMKKDEEETQVVEDSQADDAEVDDGDETEDDNADKTPAEEVHEQEEAKQAALIAKDQDDDRLRRTLINCVGKAASKGKPTLRRGSNVRFRFNPEKFELFFDVIRKHNPRLSREWEQVASEFKEVLVWHLD